MDECHEGPESDFSRPQDVALRLHRTIRALAKAFALSELFDVVGHEERDLTQGQKRYFGLFIIALWHGAMRLTPNDAVLRRTEERKKLEVSYLSPTGNAMELCPYHALACAMSVKTGKQFTRDEFLSVCEEFKGTGRKKGVHGVKIEALDALLESKDLTRQDFEEKLLTSITEGPTLRELKAGLAATKVLESSKRPKSAEGGKAFPREQKDGRCDRGKVTADAGDEGDFDGGSLDDDGGGGRRLGGKEGRRANTRSRKRSSGVMDNDAEQPPQLVLRLPGQILDSTNSALARMVSYRLAGAGVPLEGVGNGSGGGDERWAGAVQLAGLLNRTESEANPTPSHLLRGMSLPEEAALAGFLDRPDSGAAPRAASDAAAHAALAPVPAAEDHFLLAEAGAEFEEFFESITGDYPPGVAWPPLPPPSHVGGAGGAVRADVAASSAVAAGSGGASRQMRQSSHELVSRAASLRGELGSELGIDFACFANPALPLETAPALAPALAPAGGAAGLMHGPSLMRLRSVRAVMSEPSVSGDVTAAARSASFTAFVQRLVGDGGDGGHASTADAMAAADVVDEDDKDLPKTELVAQLLQAERRRKNDAAISQKEREIRQRQASLAALLEADKLGYQAVQLGHSVDISAIHAIRELAVSAVQSLTGGHQSGVGATLRQRVASGDAGEGLLGAQAVAAGYGHSLLGPAHAPAVHSDVAGTASGTAQGAGDRGAGAENADGMAHTGDGSTGGSWRRLLGNEIDLSRLLAEEAP